MRTRKTYVHAVGVALSAIALSIALPSTAVAHCDTMDGPVVTAAKQALQSGDVTPVLKWVEPAYEKEITQAFTQTIHVRSKDDESQELADRYFFETLVRVHRLGEGVAYTGLKPAGQEVEPGIEAADRALEQGSGEQLIDELQRELRSEIDRRFARVSETRDRADESVEAGRAYVAAYVDFIHYVERLRETLDASVAHAHHSEKTASPHSPDAPVKDTGLAQHDIPGGNAHKH